MIHLPTSRVLLSFSKSAGLNQRAIELGNAVADHIMMSPSLHAVADELAGLANKLLVEHGAPDDKVYQEIGAGSYKYIRTKYPLLLDGGSLGFLDMESGVVSKKHDEGSLEILTSKDTTSFGHTPGSANTSVYLKIAYRLAEAVAKAADTGLVTGATVLEHLRRTLVPDVQHELTHAVQHSDQGKGLRGDRWEMDERTDSANKDSGSDKYYLAEGYGVEREAMVHEARSYLEELVHANGAAAADEDKSLYGNGLLVRALRAKDPRYVTGVVSMARMLEEHKLMTSAAAKAFSEYLGSMRGYLAEKDRSHRPRATFQK